MSLLHNRNERHGVLPRVLYVVLVVYFEKLNRSYITYNLFRRSALHSCTRVCIDYMYCSCVLFFPRGVSWSQTL